MLAKQYRLKKNFEFVATYAQKKYVTNSYFTLNLGKQKPSNDFISKVAFVVSKKIDKRAVVRNKIKRRMREAYWNIMRNSDCSKIKWTSLIFTAKCDVLKLDYKKLSKEMEFLLNKACAKYD